MANVLRRLGPGERPLALFHGLVRVAEDCAGRAPRFDLAPLPNAGLSPARLKAWFRQSVGCRGAEASGSPITQGSWLKMSGNLTIAYRPP